MISLLIHIINICSVLLSSVGVFSYRHYCQGELKSSSVFVDLTLQCCKKKAEKKCIKKAVRSCCQRKRKCSFKKRKNLFTELCHNKNKCSNKKFPDNKTVLKKKNCCSDKSDFSKSVNLISFNFDVESSLFFIPDLPLKPVCSFFCEGYLPLAEAGNYYLKEFYPPPDIPLYLLYQFFLC